MKKSQCTEEQIAWALHQHEGGMSVAEVTRRLWDLGADVLPVEEELRGTGAFGGSPAEGAGG